MRKAQEMKGYRAFDFVRDRTTFEIVGSLAIVAILSALVVDMRRVAKRATFDRQPEELQVISGDETYRCVRRR